MSEAELIKHLNINGLEKCRLRIAVFPVIFLPWDIGILKKDIR